MKPLAALRAAYLPVLDDAHPDRRNWRDWSDEDAVGFIAATLGMPAASPRKLAEAVFLEHAHVEASLSIRERPRRLALRERRRI